MILQFQWMPIISSVGIGIGLIVLAYACAV